MTGGNIIGLTVEGAGKVGLRLMKYVLEKINQLGIPTHYIDADIENSAMTVKKATMFGRGVEDNHSSLTDEISGGNIRA